MKPTETVMLTEYVRNLCPQQHIAEYTADAWHDVLGGLDLADCRGAAAAVAGRKPFVAPAEIIAEVTRIRGERIARSVIPAPPPELCDNPRAYQRELQRGIAQAAEGQAPLACDQPRPLAITGPAAERPDLLRPQSLRDSLRNLRRALGPARTRTAALASPQEIARRKAAESRALRAVRDGEGAGDAAGGDAA